MIEPLQEKRHTKSPTEFNTKSPAEPSTEFNEKFNTELNTAPSSAFSTSSSTPPFSPIYDATVLNEPLESRIPGGFGGVAEYGITVRWNKNFLKIIRLLLERRAQFSLFGGVRFGGKDAPGTLTAENAFALGFDHIALALGAGRPTVLDIPNGMARGVRAASDFLMSLQLTGAHKTSSLANMQLRLPVIVIGGGLTAIDTATESLAYYIAQVEKFSERYQALLQEQPASEIRVNWSQEDSIIADEWLAHAQALAQERQRAQQYGETPRLVELLQSWGGVTVVYRKRLIDSPAYTLNHEEIEKALEEGILFTEELSPASISLDQFGAVESLHCTREQRVENTLSPHQKETATSQVTLPARSILVAAGTQPNTVLAREDALTFQLDGRYFQAIDATGQPVTPEKSNTKPAVPQVLLHKTQEGRFISFLGDLHPSFSGNVVKAMGSAKQGYPTITEALKYKAPTRLPAISALKAGLSSTIHAINRLTSNIVEIVVKAPLAAQQFEPGQFYRLQNFETTAEFKNKTRLAMEGLALTGASVNRTQGLVSLIALEMGGSSNLCVQLKVGEPVVLMGPAGHPTEIPSNETVLLIGGGLGNAVLFSIGTAMRAKGCRVLYFAGYKKLNDRYKVEDIEAAADSVVWCCDESPGFTPTRAQDKTFVGNIVQAITAYAQGRLSTCDIPLEEVTRLIVIGSDRMMAAIAQARHQELKAYLKARPQAIGSINSPMQCMMKEICAQCLQAHKDPETGKIYYVYSCVNQDQSLDTVDFEHLSSRLAQNVLQEKLTTSWLKNILTH